MMMTRSFLYFISSDLGTIVAIGVLPVQNVLNNQLRPTVSGTGCVLTS